MFTLLYNKIKRRFFNGDSLEFMWKSIGFSLISVDDFLKKRQIKNCLKRKDRRGFNLINIDPFDKIEQKTDEIG